MLRSLLSVDAQYSSHHGPDWVSVDDDLSFCYFFRKTAFWLRASQPEDCDCRPHRFRQVLPCQCSAWVWPKRWQWILFVSCLSWIRFMNIRGHHNFPLPRYIWILAIKRYTRKRHSMDANKGLFINNVIIFWGVSRHLPPPCHHLSSFGWPPHPQVMTSFMNSPL